MAGHRFELSTFSKIPGCWFGEPAFKSRCEKSRRFFCPAAIFLAILLCAWLTEAERALAESEAVEPATASAVTNYEEVAKSYQNLQEQLKTIQHSLERGERGKQETDAATARQA